MFLITNKHFDSQTFGLETVFSCWLLLLVVALTCCPSDWLIDDDETDVPSSHLPRRVFPVRLQNLSQLHLDQTQSRRCGVWWRIRTRRSDGSLCFDFIYSPSFYFLWQKMVLLLSERRGGGRCSSLNLSFRGRCDFFSTTGRRAVDRWVYFVNVEETAMLRWRDVTEWHFIVILYVSKRDEWIWTVWYVNLQSGKIVQA